MKRNKTDADMQFACPMCNATLKQIDKNPFNTNDSYGELVPYGCYNCGHVSLFVQKFLDDYIERKLDC